MNGKQLKNSILQWAIQGKLVPQDPNDEPASVLLERIREEKARLVKEGKIKKDKNESIIFRGDDNSHYEKFLATGEVKCIDDEIPFEIPEGWEWIRLSSIVSILGDGIHGTPEYDDAGDIFFINGNNLNNGKIIIKADTKRLNRTEANKHRRALDKNTILVSINGTIGNIAFYNNENIILGKSACYFNILGNIDKNYIKLIIESDYFISYAKSVATGSTIKNVPLSGMRNFLVPLPPIKEQTRIVSKMSDLSVCINYYSRLQKEVNRLNHNIFTQFERSILQEAIQGKLVPQDPNDEPASVLLERIREEKQRLLKEGKLKKKDITDSVIFKGDDNKYFEKVENDILCLEEEIPFEIPDSWSWVRLNDICEYIQRGKSPKYSEVKKYPVVAQKCNQWSGFSLEKALFIDPNTLSSYGQERFLQHGDLLWNSTGLGTLGRMAIYNESVNPYGVAVADSHVTVIRPIKSFINFEYLYLYFSSNEVQSVIEDKADGSTKQKELATKTIKSYLVPLPPLSEQHRIVAKYYSIASIMRG